MDERVDRPAHCRVAAGENGADEDDAVQADGGIHYGLRSVHANVLRPTHRSRGTGRSRPGVRFCTEELQRFVIPTRRRPGGRVIGRALTTPLLTILGLVVVVLVSGCTASTVAVPDAASATSPEPVAVTRGNIVSVLTI